MWIVDAHGYEKRFIVRADEMLSAFLELQRAIHAFAVSLIARNRSAEVSERPGRNYQPLTGYPLSGLRRIILKFNMLRSNSASCLSWLFSMSIPQNDKHQPSRPPRGGFLFGSLTAL